MNIIKLNLEGDGCWNDLKDKINTDQIIWMKDGVIHIAALSKGMKSGKPSISIRLNLPDGRVVVAETSMQLFLTAAAAMNIKYEKELQ